MLTPQDISEKRFDKAVFGGYDMVGVDDFLEVISADYNTLFKENAILKSKLKVLVEKVEEYRSTEDAMRMALLTAQRMGEDITIEATKAREEMLKSTNAEVKAKLSDIANRIAAEELKLTAASKETTKFLELSQAIMRKHSEFLKKLETANQSLKVPAKPAQAKSAPAAGRAPAPAAAQVPAPSAPSKIALTPTPAPAPMPKPAPTPVQTPVAPVMPPMPKVTVAPPEFEFDSIVDQIGSAVEEMTGTGDNTSVSGTRTAAPATDSPEPPISLFQEKEDTIELPETGSTTADISPRPKFDFDDLKFGANFESDD